METHARWGSLYVVFFALIFTMLLVMKFYRETVIGTVEQADMVVQATRSTRTSPGCHTFMGVTLPKTKACYLSLGGDLLRKPHTFPITNVSMMIYNRVHKCGSETVNSVIGKLARKNQFTYRHSKMFHHHLVPSDKQVGTCIALRSFTIIYVYRTALFVLEVHL